MEGPHSHLPVGVAGDRQHVALEGLCGQESTELGHPIPHTDLVIRIVIRARVRAGTRVRVMARARVGVSEGGHIEGWGS